MIQFASVLCVRLSFGWQGPFLRNQEEQPLTGFEHYENPMWYLDIHVGNWKSNMVICSCVLNLEAQLSRHLPCPIQTCPKNPRFSPKSESSRARAMIK